jgi:hypothetical protein
VARFVQLTRVIPGTGGHRDVWVNPDQVQLLTPSPNGGTVLILGGDREGLEVLEDVEDVVQLLEGEQP